MILEVVGGPRDGTNLDLGDYCSLRDDVGFTLQEEVHDPNTGKIVEMFALEYRMRGARLVQAELLDYFPS